MRSIILAACVVSLAPTAGAKPDAQSDPALEFLEEELKVVSASRRETPLRRAPATVYVITAQDIKLSGAVTLYDALRMVPGVDVSGHRALNGAVSIRGLNKVSNNRLLVLLDGKTVLNGYFDSVTWETIPVDLASIDRIEIVQGATSALYGSNALTGVINIITKTPDQADGGRASYAYGQRQTHLASALYAGRKNAWAYRLDGGLRSSERFDAPGRAASDSGRARGYLEWADSDRKVSLDGAIVDHRTQTGSAPARSFDDGQTGFLRLDAAAGANRGRFFWNAGRSVIRNSPELQDPDIVYDTFDVTLDRTHELPQENTLTVEAAWRRNQARSKIFATPLTQDLFSGAFEDQWRPAESFALLVGARLDRHPLAGWFLSPRGTAQWFASESHALRFSAGLGFRNPTLLENYIDLTVPTALGNFRLAPNADLRPERMRSFEIGYNGAFDRLRLGASAFQYTLTDMISASETTLTSVGPPPEFFIQVTNRGAVRALGYELSADVDLRRGASAFANYSYQSLKDEQGFQKTATSAPKHKGNLGARVRHLGWSGQAWVHAVDQTVWANGTSATARVPAYAILNLGVAYRFSRSLDGLEIGGSVFNLTDNRHYEMAPFTNTTQTGQGAERLGSRWLLTVAYRFK